MAEVVLVQRWAALSYCDRRLASFVAITPVRVLDTRDPNNVGLAGPFVSAVSQDLTITGTINTTVGDLVVVPAGATAVSMNVTVVSPSADGFLSVRPADAPGAPTTSSLNFTAGDYARGQ